MAGLTASRAFQPEPRREKSAQDADPFLAFNSEAPEPQVAPAASPFVPPVVQAPFSPAQVVPAVDPPYRVDPPVNLAPITIGLCVGLAGIATAGVLYFQLGRQHAVAARQLRQPAAVIETHGTVTVNSRPEGARVVVDGQLHGATPLTLSLAVGNHDIELQNGSSTRKLPVTIAGGETISQVVDLDPEGFVTIRSPFNLRVTEGGRLVGMSAAGKLTLPPGRHDLEVANAAVDFRSRITVYITPGQMTTTSVDAPHGSVSINALPWASVWLDGRSVGLTPLANLKVPIGSHEIVWRHPTLGERKRVVQVTARTPLRIGMDFHQ